jgi:hypothetical protein
MGRLEVDSFESEKYFADKKGKRIINCPWCSWSNVVYTFSKKGEKSYCWFLEQHIFYSHPEHR